MRARLLDLGRVGALRSQSMYHAITDCMEPDSDVVISLMRPSQPYVSIGYFQEAAREVELEFCEMQGLPVIRRHVGGGAVLLDGDQLFFHLMLPQARAREFGLPAGLAERFAYLARPPIVAYQRLGVEAEFRPINDIHVRGRKIGGTGVGEIGAGLVFAGSMMFDFNTALMAQVLKVPDEKLRDKIADSLDGYMTTLAKELGAKPPLAEVAETLCGAFEESYGLELVPSMPTPDELDAMYRWDEALGDPEWLHAVQLPGAAGAGHDDGAAHRDVKISASVRVLHAQHKAPGGMLRVSARVVEGRVDDLLISGDFPVTPKSALVDLAERLRGAPLALEALGERVEQAYRTGAIETAGVRPEDFGTVFQQLLPVPATRT